MPKTETQDWRALGAGRELDALVAERVMGMSAESFRYSCVQREWYGAPTYFSFGWDLALADAEERCARENDRRGATFRPEVCNLSDYSTNIADAWDVVEKMRAGGYDVTVICQASGPVVCEIAKPEWQGSEVCEANSIGLSVCRAALAASEVMGG